MASSSEIYFLTSAPVAGVNVIFVGSTGVTGVTKKGIFVMGVGAGAGAGAGTFLEKKEPIVVYIYV